MSEMPGPDVAVKARATAQPAPRTMPIEAISSSAWTIAAAVRPVAGSVRCRSQSSMNVSQSDDEGVGGSKYAAYVVDDNTGKVLFARNAEAIYRI